MTETTTDRTKLLELTSEIVSAHVANNHVPSNELSAVIETVFATLAYVETNLKSQSSSCQWYRSRNQSWMIILSASRTAGSSKC